MVVCCVLEVKGYCYYVEYGDLWVIYVFGL